MATVTSEAVQDHGVAHSPQTAQAYPVKYLIDTPEYPHLFAAPRFHLGHERQRFQFASAIERRKNLFPRAYFHEFSRP
jgi:hypothetical protein